MSDHVYKKDDLIKKFDNILGKKAYEIDDKSIFLEAKIHKLQKGIIGNVIEQCVLNYPADPSQEPDLIIIDENKTYKSELKSTGLRINSKRGKHYIAKEPMSITAVGIYDLPNQQFDTSHFWKKLEKLLIVYYHYTSDKAVPPYEYRNFPIVGYEFHEFSPEDKEILKRDWEKVKALAFEASSKYSGPHNKEWESLVKNEYINTRKKLRGHLNYIDLAPKFPPRFRLKKNIVSTIVANHFGYELEQLPGKYVTISDIDSKCSELTALYSGKTIKEIADLFNINLHNSKDRECKNIGEQITIAMFGGTSKKLNKIELFHKYGIIGKTIVTTATGGRTEDMKLYHIDFEEMIQQTIQDDDGTIRDMQFEDSEIYNYFNENSFLYIIFQEPLPKYEINEETGKSTRIPTTLSENTFIGFKRITFSEEFINSAVKLVWEDTRDKIVNKKLKIEIEYDKNGNPKINPSGSIKSAPNFIKSKQNIVFIRGSATKTTEEYKTECVNNIPMLPQYIWIKGAAIVDELNKI